MWSLLAVEWSTELKNCTQKSSIKIFLILKIVTRSKILKKSTFKEDKNKIILDSRIQRIPVSKKSRFKKSTFKIVNIQNSQHSKEVNIQRSQHSKKSALKKSTFKEVNTPRSHNLGIVENSRITRIKKIKSLVSEGNLKTKSIKKSILTSHYYLVTMQLIKVIKCNIFASKCPSVPKMSTAKHDLQKWEAIVSTQNPGRPMQSLKTTL